VHTQTPTDRLVRGRALGFRYSTAAAWTPKVVEYADPDPTAPGPDGISPLLAECLAAGDEPATSDPSEDAIPTLLVEIAEQTSEALHANALGQLAGRARIPVRYLRELIGSANPDLRKLGIEVLETHYGATANKDNRYLVRSVEGEVRGFLSDAYRRLDSRPLLEEFAIQCQGIGAVPVEGTWSDTRMALKAYIPTIYEPIPGEPLLIGLEWHNSDFGCGSYTLRVALLRLFCKNGCTFDDAIRNIHLGRRLSGGDIAYSEETYRADTKASALAMGDVIKHHMSPEAIATTMASIAAAHTTTISTASFAATIKKALNKGEAERVMAAFTEDRDVEHLPPLATNADGSASDVQSVWRASNAISWIAGQTTGDRKLQLGRLAGKIIETKVKAA